MRLEANIPGRGLANVVVDGSRITGVEVLGPAADDKPFISPGLVDIQVNGFAGVDFSDPQLTSQRAASVLPAIWKTGVASFCPTLITNKHERLLRNFRILEEAGRLYPQFAESAPCFHLEGPYLSPEGARGAHNPGYMRLPDWEEFQELQKAAGGRIRILTLAPELPGALDLIRRVRASGVVVALGHTDALAEQIRAAVEAGARLSTHLGNGCPQMIHRHLNPLWAQLAADKLSASIICDGFHLPSDLVNTILRAKGIDRCILITDAVHVATLAPGRYTLADTEIELLPSQQVVLNDGKTMAGSAASMNRVVEIFMQFTGAPLYDALAAATANPARLLGSDEVCSRITEGQPANLFIFRRGPAMLNVESVLLRGKRVYPPDEHDSPAGSADEK